MVSHGGSDDIREQSVTEGQDDLSELVCSRRRRDKIVKLNSAVFTVFEDLYPC